MHQDYQVYRARNCASSSVARLRKTSISHAQCSHIQIKRGEWPNVQLHNITSHTGVIVVVPTANRTTVMDTPAASSAVPCDYDAQRGGFPLAVLEHPPPAEFCCVACQRIARDAVTACKGPRASSPSRAHESALRKAAIFLALVCAALLLLQLVTSGAPAARPPRCPSSSARAAVARTSASPRPARPHVLPLRRWARGALRGAGGRGRWGRWTRTGRSAGARGSRARWRGAGDGGAGRDGRPHRGRPRPAPVRPRQGRPAAVARPEMGLFGGCMRAPIVSCRSCNGGRTMSACALRRRWWPSCVPTTRPCAAR